MAIRTTSVIRAGLAGAALLLSACDAELKPTASYSISDLITSVTDQSGTIQAVLHQGAPPASTTGDSTRINGIGVAINGGSSPQTLSRTAAFTRVIVSVDGFDDYYELTLPGAQTTQNVLLGLNRDASAGTVFFSYALGDGAGLGLYARQTVRLLQIGTGDIQVSVAWTDTADVDLHIVDPQGGHLYFANDSVPSGGRLDLDANAACSKNTLADGSRAYVSNENTFWPMGQAPNGQYLVFLDYWSDCGVAQTDWVVTVQRAGQAPQIFTGSFVGSSTGQPDDTVGVFSF